ncbi:unnamed protein product [Arabidopsis arenosa]|uniref:Peptidase A1 domain-containing protein n=1 Tax=Arabidopsis arenosa TaxID=38785 RepID=A0A8S2AVD7_ARAAE|nr:unnamed protein product [Arabidopsis arenosa]
MASLFSSVLLSLCLLSSPFLSNANAKSKLGFTADLIHRDSPKSPFYNPTETSSQRLRNAIHRSVSRVFHFTDISQKDASDSEPQIDLTSNSGEYLMNISLGTPPFPIMAIADTGSDLLWTQCKPCDDCYPQVDPLFDPKASSTYKDVSCSSSQCNALENQASCSTEDNTCSYSTSYGDRSYTKGNIAVDTLTLGSTDTRPEVQYPGSDSGTGEGNIIIDSGTTLTLLPTEFYSELEDAVASSIDAEKKQDPQTGLSLCYSATGDLKVPAITMHFDGADVMLKPSNCFVQVSEDLVCFAFRGSPSFSIYGNVAQMNFLVGYDTVSKTVSFKPTDCAKM